MRGISIAVVALIAVSPAAWAQTCEGSLTLEDVAKETGTSVSKLLETEDLAIQDGTLDRRTFRCAMLRMKTAIDLMNLVNKGAPSVPTGSVRVMRGGEATIEKTPGR